MLSYGGLGIISREAGRHVKEPEQMMTGTELTSGKIKRDAGQRGRADEERSLEDLQARPR